MKKLRIKQYLRYIFGIAILLFILNKLYLRPWVLKNDVPDFFIIATNSIPNLIEAIVGTILVTGILLYIRLYFIKKTGVIRVKYFHILGVFLAAAYVITQEVQLHNLGGNNVYDPNDLIASLIGLSGTFLMIQLLGFTDSNN